jgi:hypothetical protein
MNEFFRYPHLPHLAWLGHGDPREDKLLSASEARQLLAKPAAVEEKLDGANLGLSIGPNHEPRAQNRGQYLHPPFTGQFSRLAGWLSEHRVQLCEGLGTETILFGEWCAARHSIGYDALPDWYIAFDVYDTLLHRFWSAERRDRLCRQLGIHTAHRVASGKQSLASLSNLVMRQRSGYGSTLLEGLIIRRDSGSWREYCAKLVRPGFSQVIDTHWRRRPLDWNRLAPSTGVDSAGRNKHPAR